MRLCASVSVGLRLCVPMSVCVSVCVSVCLCVCVRADRAGRVCGSCVLCAVRVHLLFWGGWEGSYAFACHSNAKWRFLPEFLQNGFDLLRVHNVQVILLLITLIIIFI